MLHSITSTLRARCTAQSLRACQYLWIGVLLACAPPSLSAMEQDPATGELLEQYPAPSFISRLRSHAFCCDIKQEIVHKKALKEAQHTHDALKASVLGHVYEGYFFQTPQWLLGGPQIRRRNFDEKWCLRAAIQNGRSDLVALLLAHGAPPNTCLYSQSLCRYCQGVATPLMSLVDAFSDIFPSKQAQFEQIFRLLIEHGADINQRNTCCSSHGALCPLGKAVEHNKIALAKLLIKHGADIDRLESERHGVKRTLLGHAVYDNNVQQASRLLALGADVNCRPSLLVEAYRNERKEMVALLLDHGAQLDGKNQHDHTVFHVYAERAFGAIEKLLWRAHFTRSKTEIKEGQKRIIALQCALRRLGVVKDIRLLMVMYLPEYVSNLRHCKFLLRHRIALERLVPYCQFDWLKAVYQEAAVADKDLFIKNVVPMIVAYRFNKIKELRHEQWIYDLVKKSPGIDHTGFWATTEGERAIRENVLHCLKN